MNPAVRTRILRHLALEPSHEVESLWQRVAIQLEFVEAFIKALDESGDLPPLAREGLRGARSKLETFDPSAGVDAFAKLVSEIEGDLAEVGRIAKTYTIHCVGHGHIDMNWMWSWPETVSMTHDTFASALNFMDLYPDFTYSQSQASVYAAVEKYHPEMFSEIKRRVQEGRWEVTAAHWVEGDKNLASGEALTRHLLYTRDYFARKFDLKPEDVPIDWEPDTFGHANTIPTIISQGGVKYYYACRTGGGVDHLMSGDSRPPLFYWEGPDGARVLVNRETTWYNSYVNIGDNVALPMADFARETGLHHWLNVYGIGNHGGGPTQKEIEFLHLLDGFPIYPHIVCSTAKDYFESIEKELADRHLKLPILRHELNFEFTGCYTSESLIKQANRFGENYCLEAEALCAIAGQDSRPLIREAWINVLFNQFHDILPGSGVRETREYAEGLFQEVGAITGALKREALKAIASSVNTASLLPRTCEGNEERKASVKGNPFEAGTGIGARTTGYSQAAGAGKFFKAFLIYNPCPWPRSEPVRISIYDADLEPDHIVATDEKGISYRTSLLGSEEEWGHKRINLLFYARDVPGLGYKTYVFGVGTPTSSEALVKALNNETFETPSLICSFDTQSGGLNRLQLKENDMDFAPFHGGFGSWRKVVEHDKFMSAWVLGEEVEHQSLRSNSFRTYGPSWNVGTSLPEGEGAIACRVESDLRVLGTDSSVQLSGLVHPLFPRVDFEARIDWREIGDKNLGVPGLIVDFQTDTPVANTVYETPFGSITRDPQPQAEFPSLRFCHVSFEDGGAFTLMQDCKYGFETYDTGMKMRVLRSSFNPDHAPEIAQTTLRYSVHFHNQSPSTAELCRLGASWNHPFIVAPVGFHDGPAALSDGFAFSETPNVLVTCLKQAEKGAGLVLRLVEYDGRETKAQIALNPRLVDGMSKAECVDLMERPIEGIARLDDNRLQAMVRANGVTTVRLS